MHAQQLGFDRNVYPGDTAMAELRKSFVYTAYWLNPPPDSTGNSWAGKRAFVRGLGYGFLLLWNGRLQAGLRHDAAALGKTDGEAAAEAARREGFPPGAILFLDQEEGGRLTPEQAAYIGAWVRAVTATKFLPGVYASGIAVPDGPRQTISTAQDLRGRFPSLALWVANDVCPPAPGCRVTRLAPAASGTPDALVWQYAQSPRRKEFTARCVQAYAGDGNCYAAHAPGIFLDLNTAALADPSRGR